jgi:aspartyl-tRNA(Asn)/glutamyl-tRNA(Gln) amidotransferase subunit A
MTDANTWATLLADTAQSWHGLELDASAAEALTSSYGLWRETVAASAPQLPMDSVPEDFSMVLAQTAVSEPIRFEPAKATSRTATPDDPLQAELTQIAAMLRNGAISARELTQLSLARLRAVHEATNACVSIDEEAALAHAARCDAALASGAPPGPLHGVPLAHKDLLYREGVEVGCGLRVRQARHYAWAGTAPVLASLEAAGSINLGRLHMTEWAFDPSGLNEELGTCRNPWDLDRVPGGSSSGSAVVVAARAVYAALGTDTGGSVRIPAALNGITGLKPTRNLVDVTGSMPLSHSNDTIGPLARSAADCALMMQVIAQGGAVPQAILQAMQLRFADVARGGVADLEGLRIGVPERFFREGVDARVASPLEDSLMLLVELGAVLKRVPDHDWRALNTAGAMLTRVEASARLAKLSTFGGVPPALMDRFREGLAIPGSVYVQILNERAARLKHFLSTVMAEVDVLHVPVSRVVTPTIASVEAGGATAAAARMELTVLNRPFNYLGVPSLALPCGFAVGEGGSQLPVGFQLVGRPYGDAHLLAIGAAWQARTAWHCEAPG